MRNFSILLASAVLATPAALFADWPMIHRTPQNNAVVPITTGGIIGINGAASSISTDKDYFAPVRPAVVGGNSYAAAADNGGTIFNPADDSIRIRAREAFTGDFVWDSPLLDAGNSVSYASGSGITVRAGEPTPSLYFASGTSVQRLDLATGAVIWATDFATELAGTGGAVDVINSTPVFGAGALYVQTTNFNTSPSLLVSIEPAAGGVNWSVPTGGRGQIMPLPVQATPDELIIVDTVTAGAAGLAAYNATTGAEVWNHATITSPWSVSGGFSIGFYHDLLFDNGKIYGFTYDFSAVGKLVCVDAATGALEYAVDSIGSDVPPVLIGGEFYAIGGTYGDADLMRYNAATGAETKLADLGVTVFRNYIGATHDYLHFTSSDGGIYAYDLSGALFQSNPANFSSPVSLDAAGRVFVIGGGELHMWDEVSSVQDWMNLH